MIHCLYSKKIKFDFSNSSYIYFESIDSKILFMNIQLNNGFAFKKRHLHPLSALSFDISAVFFSLFNRWNVLILIMIILLFHSSYGYQIITMKITKTKLTCLILGINWVMVRHSFHWISLFIDFICSFRNEEFESYKKDDANNFTKKKIKKPNKLTTPAAGQKLILSIAIQRNEKVKKKQTKMLIEIIHRTNNWTIQSIWQLVECVEFIVI